MPLDANGNLTIEPRDALVIINRLNRSGPGALPGLVGDPDYWYDVNNDGFISPNDVLRVINHLNKPIPEGESFASVQSSRNLLQTASGPILDFRKSVERDSARTWFAIPERNTRLDYRRYATKSVSRTNRNADYDLKELEDLLDLLAPEITSIERSPFTQLVASRPKNR